jgi:hypothetical protein
VQVSGFFELRGAEPEYQRLLAHLEEVTVCRDAVTHALVWEEERVYDDEWKLLGQSWSFAPITEPKEKVRRNINNGAITSKTLAMNVVPTNVDVVDVAKALIVVSRVMRELEHKFGNPKAWVGPFPSAENLVTKFLESHRNDDLEAWIAGLLRLLHSPHREDVLSRLGVITVMVDGTPIFTGISRNH